MSSYLCCDTNVATRTLRCMLRPRGTSAQSTREAFKNHGPLHQDLHLAQSKAGEGTCGANDAREHVEADGIFSPSFFLSLSFSRSFSHLLHHALFPSVLYSSSQRHGRQARIEEEKSGSERVGISSLLIGMTRACNDRAIIIRMITTCGGPTLHADVPARIRPRSYPVGWKEKSRYKHQRLMNHEQDFHSFS